MLPNICYPQGNVGQLNSRPKFRDILHELARRGSLHTHISENQQPKTSPTRSAPQHARILE